MLSRFSSKKYLLPISFLLILTWTIIFVPSIDITATGNQTDWSQTPSKIAPLALQAKIAWPRITNPAIILNGSTVEVRVQGPSNISIASWDLQLYREYNSYSLSHDTPLWNSTTGVWEVNITIPVNAQRDLYDLRIDVSDGVNQQELVEWNAIQVWHEYPANLTIFHLSDTHFLTGPNHSSDKLLASQTQAAMIGADIIINTGDITEAGTPAAFSFFKSIVRQSRLPTFVCPGNHDASAADYFDYIDAFGPDYYSVNIGPDIFLVMATTHDNSQFNLTQIGWIEQDMAASTAQFKILAFHYPLYYATGWDYRHPTTEANELLRICNDYDVDLVLMGHNHNDRVDQIGNTLWAVTTANGGNVWREPTDPGTQENGFRRIVIENYVPVVWNWTITGPGTQPWDAWSQPWNKVVIGRAPSLFHEVDLGGYVTITNNLSYPLSSQVVDFLVAPLGGGVHYLVTGASVVETVNGTDAYLVRLQLDLGVNESKIIRIFPSNAQAPTLAGIEYPEYTEPEELYYIYANWTNPISGILSASIEISLDGNPYSTYSMIKTSDGRYRYMLYLEEAAEVSFRVSASDYSVQTTTSDVYTIPSGPLGPTLPIIDPVLLLAGAAIVITVVVIVGVFYIYRRRSISS